MVSAKLIAAVIFFLNNNETLSEKTCRQIFISETGSYEKLHRCYRPQTFRITFKKTETKDKNFRSDSTWEISIDRVFPLRVALIMHDLHKLLMLAVCCCYCSLLNVLSTLCIISSISSPIILDFSTPESFQNC